MTPLQGASPLPLLPTTVVGSYSVPEWLEGAKTDYYQRKISKHYLDDIHEVVTKAALKDQERAGIDVVSGGELTRDNDIDYLLVRLPGIDIPDTGKSNSYDYYDAVVRQQLPTSSRFPLSLTADYQLVRDNTDHPVKFSFTGPFSLSRKLRNEAYADSADLVRALAELLNAEAKRLVAAGATVLQLDEPLLCGYRDQVSTAIDGINTVVDGVDASWALHICYGNRYARPSWEGHYDFLFPAVMDAQVDQLVLEFARRGYEDLDLLARSGWDRGVGVGVIDVKSDEVETAETVARRIRRALRAVSPERMTINPDCGLRHLPGDVARAKLRAMAEGTAIVRSELSGVTPPSDTTAVREESAVSPEPVQEGVTQS
ncbi:uroporphyrinogen decarboxylase/cobalamine-independent methonine synthase family protein [Haloechinothrix halophila]|uniref:hypothetical protein n=1 Tax=Haloechinothrix halophila TaxID=1069073 RepID=UPI0004151C37|nr:hypothetical protein [Haloechinothrix halophila]